jgi:RNA polymerase sigma-70 factor (sigma-E family)
VVFNRGAAYLAVDASFDRFVAARAAVLMRTAYLMLGNRADAEDVLQLTLVRTARRWSTARTAPEVYSYRVLVNLVRDHHRRARRRVAETPFGTDLRAYRDWPDHSELVAEHDAIARAVRQLAPRQREVIVLRFFADLSVADAARAMGASEGAVKTHTSRALQRLRELLGDDKTLGVLDPVAEAPRHD